MKFNSKKKVVLYILLFSLIFSICFTSFVGCHKDNGSTTVTTTLTPEVTPQGSTTPDEITTENITTPKEPTSDKVTTVTPTEVTTTLVTTPAPTTPAITTLPAEIAKQGIFSMDTGTTLGFNLEWTLDRFDGNLAYIDITLVLTTYEIYVSPRRNGKIIFGNETIDFSTERISYSGSKLTNITLTSLQIAIPAEGDIAVAEIEGKWFYNGVYANIEYDWLSAGGYICVQRP